MMTTTKCTKQFKTQKKGGGLFCNFFGKGAIIRTPQEIEQSPVYGIVSWLSRKFTVIPWTHVHGNTHILVLVKFIDLKTLSPTMFNTLPYVFLNTLIGNFIFSSNV